MPKAQPAKNYQQLSTELSDLLTWFDSTDVDLDTAIEKYQEALKIIDQLENYLTTAENKIKKIDPGF